MLKMDVSHMLAENIGEHGVAEAELLARSARFAAAARELRERRGEMPWRDLPYSQEAELPRLQRAADELRSWADTFVLLGIGGSALGPEAVQRALHPHYHNELPAGKRRGPRFYAIDNVDPERLAGVFEVIDPKTTVFCVISKSGSTLEPMALFLTLKERLEQEMGRAEARRHIVCITDPEKGTLRRVANEEGYLTFAVPVGVGGRFSELCPVGLFPAAVCGIDTNALLAGAADMDMACQTDELWKNPAFLYAALLCVEMEKGKNISVLMPYADRMRLVADWYAQLWAESLGKRLDRDGREVFVGQTPLRALGATDQHSQLQLFMEGPADKVITFLKVEKFQNTVTIPERARQDCPELGYLAGVSFNQLMAVERWATGTALARAGRPSLSIALPEVTAYTLGGLLYFFEVATAFAGAYLNINAFDQPGVEAGKIAAYAYFGRPGYESQRQELVEKDGETKKVIFVPGRRM